MSDPTRYEIEALARLLPRGTLPWPEDRRDIARLILTSDWLDTYIREHARGAMGAKG